MATVSTPHSSSQLAIGDTESAVKEAILVHRLLAAAFGHRHEVAAGAHVHSCRVQIHPGQFRRETLPPAGDLDRRLGPALVRAHRRVRHCRVDVSPGGATGASQSIERERPKGVVTNDAAVGHPDHAEYRAIGATVKSVFTWAARLTTIVPDRCPSQLLPSARLRFGHNNAEC